MPVFATLVVRDCFLKNRAVVPCELNSRREVVNHLKLVPVRFPKGLNKPKFKKYGQQSGPNKAQEFS